MRNFIFLILSFVVANLSFAVINFTNFPSDYQLFGRDKISNKAYINFSINYDINENEDSFDSLKVFFYRQEEVIDTQGFDFPNGEDHYLMTFNFELLAELANYKIQVLAYIEGQEIPLNEANHLVAGDVIVIQGQSNAEAKKRFDSANEYQSEFIRVFAGAFEDPEELNQNLTWNIAQGNGNRNSLANCGQWGLFLARHLVDSLGIPIAIFNGAHGGKQISFFLKPTFEDDSLSTNYERLLYRLKSTGLQEYVNIIYWSQGEKDAVSSVNSSTEEYMDYFSQLKNSWDMDFPNLRDIYIFQTAKGCITTPERMQKIVEAQRLIAFNDNQIHLIPTHGIPFFSDSCHFDFENGYKEFGRRAYYYITHFTYNIEHNYSFLFPEIVKISFSYPNIVNLHFNQKIQVLRSLARDFYLNSNLNMYSNLIEASDTILKVHFDEEVNELSLISYMGTNEQVPSFVNLNGYETARFNLLNSVCNINSTSDCKGTGYFISPNPTSNYFQIKSETKISYYKIYDVSGQVVQESSNMETTNNVYQFFCNEIKSGLYILETNLGKLKFIIN